MPAPLRSRRAWIVFLAAGALFALLARGSLQAPWPLEPWTEASAAGASAAGSKGGKGAASELARTRREQALIRAEETLEFLRALEAAPTLRGGGS